MVIFKELYPATNNYCQYCKLSPNFLFPPKWEGKKQRVVTGKGCFLMAFVFHATKNDRKDTSLDRQRHAPLRSQADCVSLGSFGCPHKDLLQLLMPQFFSLQHFLCHFPVPEQIGVLIQVYRDQLLMCLWNSLAPDRPLMTFSKKLMPLLLSLHSPANTGGREEAHTPHT